MGAEPVSADFLSRQDTVPLAPMRRQPSMLPLERLMVALVGIALATSCWLISSPGGVSESGARPWRPGSVLQAITTAMSLNFEHPTRRGNEIKWLTQGLAVALALGAGAVGWFIATRRKEQSAVIGADPLAPSSGTVETGSAAAMEPVSRAAAPAYPTLQKRLESLFTSLTPSNSAQLAFLLFAGWAFLTAWWAPWPAGAMGESFRQFVPIVWAIVLGRTLKVRGVRAACATMVTVLTLTAIIGLWYYFERNPEQRLKFPIGNPIFMGACLLPVVVLPLAFLVTTAGALLRRGRTSAMREGSGEFSTGLPKWWWTAGAAVALGLAGWALALTGSRGPVVGLFLGLAAVIYTVAQRHYRWVILALTGIAIVLASYHLIKHMDDDAARGSTIRFRLYAWRIALERFVVRPVTGCGQGAFLLGAQAKALDDFVNDPVAFPNPMLDHVHNEWLEILSDLGAAGFALVSTALGVTFWAAGLALARLRNVTDRACLFGLIGSLAALIAEEATSVGMHKPVIPLVFYTLVGLIWALARSTEKHPPNAISHPPGQGLRIMGMIAGILGAVAMAWIAIADWHGALAQYHALELAGKKDWPAAMEQATASQKMRLSIEDRLWAMDGAADIAGRAAGFWAGELDEVLRGARERGLTPGARSVALEIAANFEQYFQMCIDSGQAVLNRLPFYPHVASWMAEAFILHDQEQAVEGQLGLRTQGPTYLQAARSKLTDEYRCNALDPDAGIRLLQLTPADDPLKERLNLIRIPLRSGPIHPLLRPSLLRLMQDSAFSTVMNDLLTAAQTAVAQPAAAWPDSFSPETLRLAALCEEITRDQVLNAVSVGRVERESQEARSRITTMALPRAQKAADMLVPIRSRFPSAASFARADQARYQLVAVPSDPEAALKIYNQAVAEWMAGGSREQQKQLQSDLSKFLWAADHEHEALTNLQRLSPTANPKAAQSQLAAEVQELCQWFINASPGDRPTRFDGWVARLVEMAPESAIAQWMAAQVAIEHGEQPQAFARLDEIEKLNNGQNLETAVKLLLKRFPDDTALRDFVRARQAGTQPSSEPSSTAPASAPAATAP